MNLEEKICYKCQTIKPLTEFGINRMKFQLKSQKNRVFCCISCEIKNFEKNGERFEFNFETEKFEARFDRKEYW